MEMGVIFVFGIIGLLTIYESIGMAAGVTIASFLSFTIMVFATMIAFMTTIASLVLYK